jgi:hypothetical protein
MSRISGIKKALRNYPKCLICNWLPFVDAYRIICIAPSSEARAEFEAIRELGSEA